MLLFSAGPQDCEDDQPQVELCHLGRRSVIANQHVHVCISCHLCPEGLHRLLHCEFAYITDSHFMNTCIEVEVFVLHT